METKYAVPNYTFANLPGRRVLKAKKLLGMYITQNEKKNKKSNKKTEVFLSCIEYFYICRVAAKVKYCNFKLLELQTI